MNNIAQAAEKRKTPSISSGKTSADMLKSALELAQSGEKNKDFVAAATTISILAVQARKGVY